MFAHTNLQILRNYETGTLKQFQFGSCALLWKWFEDFGRILGGTFLFVENCFGIIIVKQGGTKCQSLSLLALNIETLETYFH